MGKEFFDEMLNRNPWMIQGDIDSVDLKRGLLCKEILHDGLKDQNGPMARAILIIFSFFSRERGLIHFAIKRG